MGINLAAIRAGWRARMKGTYWEGKMPEVAGETLECLNPIKPKDNPDFIPDRFTFQLPENVHWGTIVVFSANDVSEWLPAESEELTE